MLCRYADAMLILRRHYFAAASRHYAALITHTLAILRPCHYADAGHADDDADMPGYAAYAMPPLMPP